MEGNRTTGLNAVESVAKERRLWFWRIALGSILALVAVAFFLAAFFDFRIPLSSVIRWSIWAVVVFAALVFLTKNRFQIFSRFTPEETARAMESERPEAGQRIRTALEVVGSPPQNSETHGFRERLVAETESFLNQGDWRRLIPRGEGLRRLLTFLAIVISLMIAAVARPEFGLALKRVLFPATAQTYTQVAWENPPEWYDQRHPPLLRLGVTGRDATPTLFVKEAGQEQWETVSLTPRENSRTWDAVLTGRSQNLSVYAMAGDGKTEELLLQYEPIPELREARVHLEFPEYIERKDEERSGGDVRALEGTKATWTFVFNTAPAKVEWAMTGEGDPELIPPAETCVTSVHTLEAGTRNPVLTVTDRRGRPVDSWRFEVEGLEDKLPQIEILEPAKDLDATSITEIPVRIRAKDDYGLGEVGVVLEAAGETRWILEKVIDTGNQRQANEMVAAMLEQVPLEITDNVRLYAYALDRKPRGGPRSLSHLRSIDIRQFKRRWKFRKLESTEGGGPKIKMEDIVGLEKIIERQRGIVSEVFVLKGGGRDTISQDLIEKCAGEAAREDALSLDVETLVAAWLEAGRIEQDDITLLEVAGEQMVQAGKELRVPNRDAAFEVADSSLSNLLRLRKRLMTMILKSDSKEGEPMDPKEQPPMLTKLADEARRLAREEADVQAQIEDEEIAKSTSPEVTRRQQDVAIYDAGELYSRLLTHPERTEGALDLMNDAEVAMKDAGNKLHSDSEAGAVLDLAVAEQRLLELAEFLTVLEMQMASEALEKMANEMEKEAEELAEKSESDSEGEGDEESESEKEAEPEGEKDSESKGEKESPKGEEKGQEESKGKSKSGKSKSGESKSGEPESKGSGKSEKGENSGDSESESSGEKSDGKSSGDSKGESSGKGEENSEGGEDPDGGDEQGSDEADGKSAADEAELLARAARRARLTDEVLKALAERESKKGMASEPEDGSGEGEGDQSGEGEKENDKGESGKEGEGDQPGDGGKPEDEDGKGSGSSKAEALAELRKGLGMGELAEALEQLAEARKGEGKGEGKNEGKGTGPDGEGEGDSAKELAEKLGAAGQRMRELARELNSSELARLAEVKEEIENLKKQLEGEGNGEGDEPGGENGKTGQGGEENPFAALLGESDPAKATEDGRGGESEQGKPEDSQFRGPGAPTGRFASKLDRLNDERIRSWGRYLHNAPFDRNMIPILEAIEKRVDELVGEIPQISAVAGGRRAVPEENRREIEDYFRDLSNDFGGENWIEGK